MMNRTTEQADSPTKLSLIPISEFADYPCFVRPVVCADNPEMACSIDLWAVEPTGHWDADRATGEHYADLAVSYARAKNQPEFINFVLAGISCYGRRGWSPPGSEAIEAGFFARIARLAYVGSMS